jgi:hypothetical protein
VKFANREIGVPRVGYRLKAVYKIKKGAAIFCGALFLLAAQLILRC